MSHNWLAAEVKLAPRAARLLMLPSSGVSVGKAQVLEAEMSSFLVPPLADLVIVGKVNWFKLALNVSQLALNVSQAHNSQEFLQFTMLVPTVTLKDRYFLISIFQREKLSPQEDALLTRRKARSRSHDYQLRNHASASFFLVTLHVLFILILKIIL